MRGKDGMVDAADICSRLSRGWVRAGGGHPVKKVVRVLLVEDHAIVRELFASAFDREPDFEVVAQAGSLAEARGSLEGVDVAVLDLRLPDGGGPTLLHSCTEDRHDM